MPEKAEYLLVKRGYYYRPDNCGYTGWKREAGRYPASDAQPDAGVIAVHENAAAEFSPDCDPYTRMEIAVRVLSEQVRSLGAQPAISLAIK